MTQSRLTVTHGTTTGYSAKNVGLTTPALINTLTAEIVSQRGPRLAWQHDILSSSLPVARRRQGKGNACRELDKFIRRALKVGFWGRCRENCEFQSCVVLVISFEGSATRSDPIIASILVYQERAREERCIVLVRRHIRHASKLSCNSAAFKCRPMIINWQDRSSSSSFHCKSVLVVA
jgi:hypothetical protein